MYTARLATLPDLWPMLLPKMNRIMFQNPTTQVSLDICLSVLLLLLVLLLIQP
jgi:hypothetical protein